VNVVLDKEAKEEAREAALFYEASRAGLGQEFTNALDSALVAIQERPELWRRFKGPFRRYILRRFPYAVIYAIEPEQIYVPAVAHTSRRPGYWLDRARDT
jgi:plasmid stabilization system protein ParE